MSASLYIGATGLQSHQQRLDVIATNIANVNTTGYKSSSIQFQDLMSQTLQGASAPSGALGGTNAIQKGLGVTVGSISTNFTQTTINSTGVNTDLAIDGDGFFVLSDGEQLTYTRDGSFGVDADGYLVEPSTGQYVQCYVAEDGVVDATGTPENLQLPQTLVYQETTNVVFTGNLDSETVEYDAATETGVVTRTIEIYDSLGTARELVLEFRKTANDGEWEWAITSADDDIASINLTNNTIAFDSNGQLITGGTNGTVEIQFEASPPMTAVPSDATFTFDFSELTQLASESDASLFSQDGYAPGTLESFSITTGGLITGVYSNGMTQIIGQVGVATFSNNGGLVRVGDNQFAQSANSGEPSFGAPGTGGRGSVSGGVLESSNVDLTSEFSNLILTQRGFQANARSITAADTLLQETVNLVR